jgi:CBS domain-containing protein
MKTIRDVMRNEPVVVHPEDSVHHALELLIDHDISGLPVTGSNGDIVGVLTEKDLMKAFYEPAARTVGALMTKDPTTISVDAPLVDVVDCLMANDFRRVLIHDQHKLVGLISRADLMPPILESLLDRT